MANKRERSLDYKCPTCNAVILYNAKNKKWNCEYCGNQYTIEDLKKYNKVKKIEENIEDINEETTPEYITYHCKDCGAEIIADAQTSATFCVYCGNTAILKSKLVGKFAPDMIIPFKKEKQIAINEFKNLSKGRPLVPKGFNNEKNIERIRGIYIPFWIYDICVDGEIVLDAKDVSTWSSGNYRYTKTDTYSLIRDGSMNFYKIPVDGSTRFDNNIMNTLEPFNYNELEEFNYAYLSGCYAEKYDQHSDELYNFVANRAVNSAKSIMSQSSKVFTTKVIVKDTLKPIPLNKKYVLLPVWMVNVKYKDKMYIFAMNGQTGEFIGDIPIDVKKTILFSILIFIGVFILIVLISIVIYMIGRTV